VNVNTPKVLRYVKVGMVRVWVASKTCYTRATSERFRDNSRYFSLLHFTQQSELKKPKFVIVIGIQYRWNSSQINNGVSDVIC